MLKTDPPPPRLRSDENAEMENARQNAGKVPTSVISIRSSFAASVTFRATVPRIVVVEGDFLRLIGRALVGRVSGAFMLARRQLSLRLVVVGNPLFDGLPG